MHLGSQQRFVLHKIDSDAGAHFEVMVTLIEGYEARHYPMSPPDPIEAILFRMEQQGLKTQRPGAHDWADEPGVRSAQWQAQADHGDGVATAYRARDSGGEFDSAAGLSPLLTATWPCCTGCRSTERDAVAGGATAHQLECWFGYARPCAEWWRLALEPASQLSP